MVSIDYSVFFQIVNFLILLAVLHLILYRPIVKILDEREGKIEASKRECRLLEEELLKRQADYEARLQEARVEAAAVRERLIREATSRSAATLEQVNQEITKMTDDFQRKMQDERQRARDLLGRQAELLALEVAERLLGRAIP